MEKPRHAYYAAVTLRRALLAILMGHTPILVAALLAPCLTAARDGLTRFFAAEH
ncbi:hypothetical protein [Jeongeupia naejangsanensis]|uniref:Uncharacterized protein n=1 Tax=Jeongeupia naejangsanensis TaxID=613195 RepID=A0ABS2BLM7_9NEIS|nr:hypothetical protein [Jeongeupia naejangsanensis]MBM3116519.1 hypothetical protein [Jeongeupia naejangsanensis]